ncbi:ROK family protein [Crocinitomix catalasitica]|uniref:ROK family protein n=1 Tax=Crocinitomix catalasitica TaxID=184607 RepID=UPI000488DEE1|nr:ROK family protein [Crocinitomix catalasitica]
MNNYLGVDIGGTNVCFGVVTENGEFLYENTFKTTEFESAEDLAESIQQHLKKNCKHQFTGIGIGAPSVNETNQSMEFAPNISWGEIVPLNEIFAAKFNLPIRVINDANAAAIGEKVFGEATDQNNFAVITLGTGIGLGLYIDNKIYLGSNGLAGELGHTIVRRDGRECKCGNFGCLETYVAKDGIVKTAKEKLEFSSGGSVLNNISPSNLTPIEIMKAARKEDPVALEIIQTVTRDLAFGISQLVNILDLECIYLSGGITKSGNLLKRKTEKHLKSYILPNMRDKLNLRISTLNEINGGILGAVATIHESLVPVSI